MSSLMPGLDRVTRTRALLVAAVVVAATSCSAQHPHTAGTTALSPTSAPSGVLPSAKSRPVGQQDKRGPHAVRDLEVPLPGPAGPLSLNAAYIAAPIATDATGLWSRIVLVDSSGRVSIPVRSHWSHGFINWVALAGNWVGWVDQEHQQSDANPAVRWRVSALDLHTGRQVLLSSNGNVPDPYVPEVRGTPDGRLVWSQAEPDRSAREYVWQPGQRRPRTLFRHTEMTPGSETVAAGLLMFLGPAAHRHGEHTVGGDCWTVPLAGDQAPRQVTSTALTMGCALVGDHVVWTEHIDPATKQPPPDGLLDDPYAVVTARLDGTHRRVLHRGYLPTGYPDVGAGFVAWQTPTGRAMLRSLTTAGHVELPVGVAAGSVATDGDHRLAVISGDGRKLTVFHVDVR
jgi:hypothetical protein